MGGRWLKNMPVEERRRVAEERRKAARLRGQKHYATDLKKSRQRGRDKYARNGATQRQRAREKHAADPTAERARKLKSNYGMSLIAWLALFKQQGERCACCKSAEPGSRYGWHTDHDHQTGAVRGILCELCNRLLGMMGDRIDHVEINTLRLTCYLETQ